MASNVREIIMMTSTGTRKNGKSTGTYYTTTKNKRNAATPAASKKTTGKLTRKKYDPRAYNPETQTCGMHVTFKEKKISK